MPKGDIATAPTSTMLARRREATIQKRSGPSFLRVSRWSGAEPFPERGKVQRRATFHARGHSQQPLGSPMLWHTQRAHRRGPHRVLADLVLTVDDAAGAFDDRLHDAG